MKKTIEAEDLREMNPFSFLEPMPVAIESRRGSDAIKPLPAESESTVPDTLLTAVKWIFLFLPGAVAIHCWVMMLSLFALSGIWPERVFLQSLGALIIYSFIVLLGLGRLSDLRYWKVIAAILSSSILLTVVHQAVSIFIGYDYFGLGMLLTAPITILFAQFVKVRMDKGESV